MKLRIAAPLIAAAVLPMRLAAQVSRDSIISVSANRMSRIVADRASFYLIVEGTAETTADAMARVDTKLKTVSETLRARGPLVTLDAPIAYSVGPTPAPNGYPGVTATGTNIARSVIHVRLTRADQVANVVSAAIAAGAASSSSLVFESSVADSVHRACVVEALAVARVDAAAIAKSLGLRLGALVSVNTGGGSINFQASPQLVFDANRFGLNAPSPEITMSGSATVQYRVVP